MRKKGQFYIIAAVILLAITFGLFSSQKALQKPDRLLDTLAGNYMKEAPFAANQGNLQDFTLKFYELAVTKDSNFEMLYLDVGQDNITAYNLMKPIIFINQYNLSFNKSITFDRTNEVVASIGDSQYTLNMTSGSLRAIFVSQSASSRDVKVE